MFPRHLRLCILVFFPLLIAPPFASAQTTNKSAPGASEKGSLYVTNNFDRTISVISIANYHVTGTIRVLASNISQISATIHLGSISDSTNNMSLSPNGDTLNVNIDGFERDQNTPAQGSPAVVEISTATNAIKTTLSDLAAVIKTFGMPVPVRAPFGIASSSVRSPDGTKLYITDIFNEYHSKDGDKENNMNVVWEIPIPQASPGGVAGTLGDGGGLNSQNNLKLVPVGQGPFVHGMPVPKDVNVLPVGHHPEAIAISPDGNKIYVTNADDNTVSVIDTTKNAVIATIPVGTWPKGLAVSRDGAALYVVNHGNGNNNFTGTVSVISTATNNVTHTIPIGRGPVGIVVSNNSPVQKDMPMPGDIVVYQKDGIYNHVAVVMEVKPGTAIVVRARSKWGGGAVYDHDPIDTPYGNNWTVWHRRRATNDKDPEMRNALASGTYRIPQLPLDTEPCFETDNNRPIIMGRSYVLHGHTSKRIADFPTAERVGELPKNPAELLQYDCRGFVFGGGQEVKIADEYSFFPIHWNQMQRILEDGYSRVLVKDTIGKDH